MDLQLNNALFLVGGATSGLGKAIVEQLVTEGAKVIAVARTAEKLDILKQTHQGIETLCADLTATETLPRILEAIGERVLTGAVLNSGGPPAMPVLKTTLHDWDDAYKTVVRWKIALTQALLPKMIAVNYGRLLYIESVAVKQPVENLVLSNAMRLSIVGYIKTLSQEIGTSGVTLNILGPGYHGTQRLHSLFHKNSELKGISAEQVKASFEADTALKQLGDPKNFASLAAWFLSPHSRYITGQTLAVDGGLIKGVMG